MRDLSVESQKTMREYVGVLFRHKGILLSSLLTILVTVGIGVMLKTPAYEAQVKMLITGQKRAQADYYTDIGMAGARSAQLAMTQSEIAVSDPVLERAVTVLGLAKKPFDYELKFCSRIKRPLVTWRARSIQKRLSEYSEQQQATFIARLAVEELRQRVEVRPLRDTDLFLIKVKDFNPVAAAITANVVSRSYAIFDLEQQYAEMKLKYGEKNQSVIQLQQAIESMARGLSGAPLPPLEAIGPASVKVIEQAKVPLKPAGISRAVTMVLAFIIGLFLSVMIAFGFEYADQTFRLPRQVAALTGLPYAGFVPRKSTLEDYREIAENLGVSGQEAVRRIFLFTAAMPQEGVSRLVANLGIYTARKIGKKTLLIDANVKKPALHKIFNLTPRDDLAALIGAGHALSEVVAAVDEKLDVLPVAAAAPGLLIAPALSQCIAAAKAAYEVILIDGAPVRDFNTLVAAVKLAEAVMLVVKERGTRRHVIQDALARARGRGIAPVGFVFTNRTFAIPRLIYDRV